MLCFQTIHLKFHLINTAMEQTTFRVRKDIHCMNKKHVDTLIHMHSLATFSGMPVKLHVNANV